MARERRLKWLCAGLAVGSILWTGCAVTPRIEVRRPWTRVLMEEAPIKPGAIVKVSVEGTSEPLLGDERLLRDDLGNLISSLLERRGFGTSRDHGDYTLTLRYRTTRRDKVGSSLVMAHENRVSYLALYGVGRSSGRGVEIASEMAALSVASKGRSSASAITITSEYYTHALAIEVHSTTGTLIWKSDATWDSPSVDALGEFPPAIHLLISSLPQASDNYPRVPRVKADRAQSLFNFRCSKRSFSSPALPYRVAFKGSTLSSDSAEPTLPKDVRDPEALAAYIDLVQTAEYALPIGSDAYRYPLAPALWKKVRLGQKYYLGADSTATAVLITLRGRFEGYEVADCRIASEAEYEQYQVQLDRWRKALNWYFDVYED